MFKSTSRAIAFVKFVQEEWQADMFISGKLFMRKLAYFQSLELDGQSDGRPDAQEAVWMWHQPDQVIMEFTVPGLGSTRLDKNDFAAPVSATLNFFSDMHVFCMTTLSMPDPATLIGTHDQILAQLRAAYRIDARNLAFGPYAVFVYAVPFLKHVNETLNTVSYWRARKRVEYYDETTFSGIFDHEDVPFRKQSKFAYQQEFRICLQTPPGTSDPLIFDVGDMSSFAVKIPSAELNSCLRLDLKHKP